MLISLCNEQVSGCWSGRKLPKQKEWFCSLSHGAHHAEREERMSTQKGGKFRTKRTETAQTRMNVCCQKNIYILARVPVCCLLSDAGNSELLGPPHSLCRAPKLAVGLLVALRKIKRYYIWNVLTQKLGKRSLCTHSQAHKWRRSLFQSPYFPVLQG